MNVAAPFINHSAEADNDTTADLESLMGGGRSQGAKKDLLAPAPTGFALLPSI